MRLILQKLQIAIELQKIKLYVRDIHGTLC